MDTKLLSKILLEGPTREEVTVPVLIYIEKPLIIESQTKKIKPIFSPSDVELQHFNFEIQILHIKLGI